MNKEVNPIVAIIVIAFFLAIFAAKFAVDQQRVQMDRLGTLHSMDAERASVQFGERIVWFDTARDQSRGANTDDIEITEFIGDFAWFSNGDLLFRAEGARRAGDDVAAHLRLQQRDAQAAGDGQATLYRCSAETDSCQLFSAELPELNRTFRLHIDTSTDTVYLADTARGKLFKLNNEGKVMARASGFNFPNQILLADDRLLLADTNNNRVVELSNESGKFGKVLDSHEMNLGGQHKWPSGIARVGKQWWVLIAGDNMAFGRIAMFDQQWRQTGEIELPQGADPMGMLVHKQRVIVSDYTHFRLYEFDFGGKLTDDLLPGALGEQLEQQQVAAKRYDMYGYLLWFIAGVGMAVGLLVGLMQQKKADNAQARKRKQQLAKGSAAAVGNETEHATALAKLPADGLWLEARKWPRLALQLYLGLCAVGGVTSLILLMREGNEYSQLVLLMILPLAVIIVAMTTLLRKMSARIGVFNQYIELHDHSGNSVQALWNDVHWSDQVVIVEGKAIPIAKGSGQEMFCKTELFANVVPRLLPINKLSGLAMAQYRWQISSPAMKLQMIVLGMGLSTYLIYNHFGF